ncbi:GAF domain-containing protein [Methylobacterium sp. J-068]|uniref:GAF domain-containing protein n=1 Tax=Methylobacterium sp. J-068 TaxID=2836649 RepID=UPI001FBAA774|nr:GAF domain-containing protein [Methylobacterium sp. J-068]MCJ2035509.1 GAF domain-containing protein [Methylobacterium sp. J-068]
MGQFMPPQAAADADRLAALDAYGILGTGPGAEFDGIVLLARTLCAAPTALISFVADDCQWFKARSGFGPTHTPLSQSVCAHALRQSSLLIIPDMTADPRTSRNTLVTGQEGLRFYAGAPLRTSDGYALGTLCILDTVPRPDGLTQEQAEGLRLLALQVMALLELRREMTAAKAEVVSLREKLAGSFPAFLSSRIADRNS